MGQNAEFARIYGGDSDAIYLAPIGSTKPTTINADPAAAYEDVGWLHSDGVTEAATGSKTEIRGHQGNGVVRTRVEGGGTTIAFIALEDKAQTRELRYHVKTDATAAGVRTETRSPGQRVSPRAAVIDFFDADDETVKERWIIDRLEIVPDGDRVYVNSDIAGFPFIGQIIGDYTVLSTDLENPAVTP
ncbi:hypothetical protein [Microbacterium telephonicum]|uniref:Uncharacterized protein n=1 Tax=Microbacterium telephonicum TaxID=1714841 RepID=A0A498BXD3_9MICO|nr:hypothetical protein [Microbacterium telephonicum]RLK47619.1 hypothetical protein C7474_2211 [Microbacterium telephonicum]